MTMFYWNDFLFCHIFHNYVQSTAVLLKFSFLCSLLLPSIQPHLHIWLSCSIFLLLHLQADMKSCPKCWHCSYQGLLVMPKAPWGNQHCSHLISGSRWRMPLDGSLLHLPCHYFDCACNRNLKSTLGAQQHHSSCRFQQNLACLQVATLAMVNIVPKWSRILFSLSLQIQHLC